MLPMIIQLNFGDYLMVFKITCIIYMYVLYHTFFFFFYTYYLIYLDITRRPWGNVVFHSSITNTTEIAAESLRYPNGITSNWDNSKIYVGTSTGGELLIYDRKSNNKLHLSERLFIGLSVDNLSVDEQIGEIYCAGMYIY
jgi:hypothetical protein